MKKEIHTFISLNLIACGLWALIGGMYGAYQALSEMGNVMWVVAVWLLLIIFLTLVGAVEYHAFRSLVRLLKAMYRWLELRNLLG